MTEKQTHGALATWLGGLKTRGIVHSTDGLDLRAVSTDLWPRHLILQRENRGQVPSVVDAVVWPQTTEELSYLVQQAKGSPIALYPYGAGSGVCGASVPESSETRARVIVDLKKMRRLRALDPITQTIWVEAGMIGENLERELNQKGYTLGHFPSSIYCSSVGGYLAARSAGQLSTKYGKIEDMVLALEVVWPDGQVAVLGRAPRSAMGVDWTQFLLGSEGTLCFFSAACLQIRKMPTARVGLAFEAHPLTSAMEYSRRLMQSDARPAVMRVYDPQETSLALNSAALREAEFQSGCAMVLLFEGDAGIVEAQVRAAETLAKECGLRRIGDSLARHWWEHRYAVSYRQQLILSHQRMLLDTFEVAATWDKLGDVYRSVKAVSVGAGVILAHFSHFYPTGANIYFTWVSHAGFTGDAVEKYDSIWEQLLEAAHAAGATLTHHHGVGLQKRSRMAAEKGFGIELWRRFKGVVDPENRFNPGKVGG